VAFWNKRIKDVGKTALELGEDKTKVKALKDGDLEIEGNTMDRVLKNLEEDKIKRLIKESDIWKWVQETDFRKLREKFGYDTQRDVAKLIPCDTSIICNLENHKEKFKKVSPKLIEIYNFYNNDFNRKIKKGSVKMYKVDPNIKSGKVLDLADVDYKVEVLDNTEKVVKKEKQKSKEEKQIWKWYKKTDIRELRKSKGYDNLYTLAGLVGVSQSCLSDLELKHFKRVNKTITNAYKFFNSLEEPEIPTDDNSEDVYSWYMSIKDFGEYRREFGYALNKFMGALNLSYDQARTFERHNYKSVTPIVQKIYDFYHNEDNRLEPIEWTPNKNNTYVENKKVEPVEYIKEEIKSRFEKNILEGRYEDKPTEDVDKDAIIDKLTQEVESLKRQIYLYEKLISKL
jgi:hypothetical protein